MARNFRQLSVKCERIAKKVKIRRPTFQVGLRLQQSTVTAAEWLSEHCSPFRERAGELKPQERPNGLIVERDLGDRAGTVNVEVRYGSSSDRSVGQPLSTRQPLAFRAAPHEPFAPERLAA
jgi:hypothetical protein